MRIVLIPREVFDKNDEDFFLPTGVRFRLCRIGP